MVIIDFMRLRHYTTGISRKPCDAEGSHKIGGIFSDGETNGLKPRHSA
jgi:hypothetical protein